MKLNYYMPTEVFFGKDAIKNNYEVLKGYGAKALIVTGARSSKMNGSLKDVLNALDNLDANYMIFDKVEENPSLETIEAGAKLGKEFNCDYVIGIGGGSPIDASKAIAVMIKNPNITRDTIITTDKLEALDVVAVPTTSGTGTETTQYSIVTDHDNKTKLNLGQCIFPKIAFCDPTYTMRMEYDTTLNTAIDALSHLIEGYLNINANLLTDTLVEKGIKLWGECINNLSADKLGYEEREKLMMASTLGGIVIAQTGTSIPHGMGYALTYFKGLPHGIANGVLYKEYLRTFKNQSRVNDIVEFIGLNNINELEELLNNLINITVMITEEEITEFTDGMWNNKGKLKNHPEEISYEELYNIYKNTFIL
ncbi:MAG: iron-containing alcohol dehydrogenase family protein [Clostridium sp.]